MTSRVFLLLFVSSFKLVRYSDHHFVRTQCRAAWSRAVIKLPYDSYCEIGTTKCGQCDRAGAALNGDTGGRQQLSPVPSHPIGLESAAR